MIYLWHRLTGSHVDWVRAGWDLLSSEQDVYGILADILRQVLYIVCSLSATSDSRLCRISLTLRIDDNDLHITCTGA